MKSFHVVVAAEDAELAADRLWQLGVEAVGVDDSAAGTVELWTSVGDSAEAIRRAAQALDPTWHWEVRHVSAPAETWRDHVGATWYDERGVVVPAWQVDHLTVAEGTLVTAIEPASSFGLGDHPTTALTLGLLAAHVRSARAASTIDSALDVGCGSGVLGIVAAQLGVATIRSIDISAAAIEATNANAARNGVSHHITADTAPLSAVTGSYDLVVANILAPVLVSLAGDLRRVLAPGGVLLISGILQDSHRHVLDALRPLQSIESRVRDGWISVVLTT